MIDSILRPQLRLERFILMARWMEGREVGRPEERKEEEERNRGRREKRGRQGRRKERQKTLLFRGSLLRWVDICFSIHEETETDP